MERREAIHKLQQLVGKNLHDLAKQYDVTVHKNGKVNKGWAGHALERYLELPINSAQSPNFGSWELKSIPLKYKKNGKLTFKETMAITMIDPVNVCQKPFEESHLLAKLQKAVVVARIVGEHVDEPTHVHAVVDFQLKDALYDAVKRDYDLVRKMLLDNPTKGLDALKGGGIGEYIRPRTKGNSSKSSKRPKSRAFYARPTFLAQFIQL